MSSSSSTFSSGPDASAAARVIFTGALVADGSGEPLRVCDVWTEGGRIARVEPPREEHPPGWTIHASEGLTLAPGFVDVHSHADASPFLEETDETKILQGVTTEVVGNCGSSPFGVPGDESMPLGEGSPTAYLRALDQRARPITNQAPLVGHAGLRSLCVGLEARVPTAREMARMRSVLEEALDAGAFGLSSGLFYAPGSYADTAELSELLSGLGERPLVYASHIRNEGNELEKAVQEFLNTGARTGVRLELSHHKAAGLPNWGKTEKTLRQVAEARRAGLDVGMDAYPYTASSTQVSANLPPWVLEGGRERALERLADPSLLDRIQRECEEGLAGWESMIAATGYGRMVVASGPTGLGVGQTLEAFGLSLGLSPFLGMVHLLRENRMAGSMVVHSMQEADLRRVLADPKCWIGTDGLAYTPGSHPHPRLTGTFPRVLGRYVREEGLFSLETAVYRMTGGPAAHFRIPARGRIEEGYAADLVLLSADRVVDGSTFEEPMRPPIGIASVYLGGVEVVRGTTYIGERNGVRLLPASR